MWSKRLYISKDSIGFLNPIDYELPIKLVKFDFEMNLRIYIVKLSSYVIYNCLSSLEGRMRRKSIGNRVDNRVDIILILATTHKKFYIY